MAAPIPQMLKYSIVLNFLKSPQILIKFISKYIVKFFTLKHSML